MNVRAECDRLIENAAQLGQLGHLLHRAENRQPYERGNDGVEAAVGVLVSQELQSLVVCVTASRAK